MISLLSDRVAVRYFPDPDKIGSIIVPDMAKERADQGIVKYIGSKVKEVKVGDYVIFSGYTGTAVHISEEDSLIILPEDQIKAIVHPPATQISGLYHLDPNGEVIEATYESAFNIIWQQFNELPRLVNKR